MNERISIGGQAVIEGVMMRSPTCIATAVRKPSGEIVYKKTPISKKKGKLAEIPFIRGAVMLFDALVMGIKELTFSANEAEEKEEEQISQKEAILTTVVSLGLGIGLFIVLPSLIGSFLFLDNKLYSNLLEAVLRLLFFILYIWLISFSKDVRRVYEYHGAEHKSIYAYENNMELTPEMLKSLQHYTQDVELVFTYSYVDSNYCIFNNRFSISNTSYCDRKNSNESSFKSNIDASYSWNIL